jgi:UDP-2-acetamido-3-amino-2,3-dideoxy-glucuronate N-acetyltransferase
MEKVQGQDGGGTKVVVVGAGLWGRNLVRVFGKLGVLAGVCDADESRVRASLDHVHSLGYGLGARGYSWEEVLADEDVKGVVLAVPVSRHYAMGMEALRRGKHVWIEKPMVVEVEEGESLVKCADEMGREVMVNHLMRYHGCVRKLLAMVSEGVLGRVGHIEMSRKGPGRIFADADALYDLMPHDVSVLMVLAEDCGDLLEVRGWSGGWGEGGRDWARGFLSYEDGMKATLSVSRLHPLKEQKMVVVGDRGMLVFDDRKPWHERLWHVDHKVEVRGGCVSFCEGRGDYVEVEEGEPLYEAGVHFVEVVEGVCTPLTSGREALGGLRLIEAIKEGMEC